MDFLLAMRVFVRVIECGGLSAAGRSLGLGQPAISERLRQLESHLGVRLLDRNTRSINVTDVGAVFFEHAKQAVTAAEEAASSVVSFNRKLRGTLHVAAPNGIGEAILPPLLIGLRQQHSELSINLILNNRFVDPIVEGVDIAIRVGPVGNGAFVARPLGYVRRLLLASPAYLARAGAPITLQNVGAHPFVYMDGLTKDNKIRLIGPDGAGVTTPIRPAWRCNHWRPLLDALLAGVGIGALQLPLCRSFIQDRRLVPILTDYHFPVLPLHAIYPALRKTPPKTTAALNWLQTRLPALLDDDQDIESPG